MATTSIWRVKGWLGKVLVYIENPAKTINPAFYEKEKMTEKQIQSLSDVIEYAADRNKTEKESGDLLQSFVTGVNCSPKIARQQMLSVKNYYNKEDGTVAYHGYQSFAPGEATPEIAHEIGVKLATKLWGDRYQVLVATHLDKANHLHNHFVLNTVSFVDGVKYHRTHEDYKAMRETSDTLCREYGLSVIENPKPGKSLHYATWKATQKGLPFWATPVKEDVDDAILKSMTAKQFWTILKAQGYWIRLFCRWDCRTHPFAESQNTSVTRTHSANTESVGKRQHEISQQGYRLSCPVHPLLLSAGILSESKAPEQQTPSFSAERRSAEIGCHIRGSKAACPLSHRYG